MVFNNRWCSKNLTDNNWKANKCIPTLQWRHNGRDSVSNNQPHDCLLNGLFRRRSEKKRQSCASLACVRGWGYSPLPRNVLRNKPNVSLCAWWIIYIYIYIYIYICTRGPGVVPNHYNEVVMSAMASQITSLTIVYSTVYSAADQKKNPSNFNPSMDE